MAIRTDFTKISTDELRKFICNGGINMNNSEEVTNPQSQFKGKFNAYVPELDEMIYLEDRQELMDTINMAVILHDAEQAASFSTKAACFRRDEDTGKCYKFNKADFTEKEISLADFDLELKYSGQKIVTEADHIAQAKADKELFDAPGATDLK